MDFFDIARSSLKNILHNKMRSFLTMLGIIIGVSSVIAIMALGEGSTNQIAGEFEKMGANSLDVSVNLEKAQKSDMLTIDDVKLILESDENIDSVSPQDKFTGKVSTNGKNETCYVNFVNENFLNIGGINIFYGKFFNKGEYEDKKPYIVLDSISCKKLFNTLDVVGKTVKVKVDKDAKELIICGVFDVSPYFSGLGSIADSLDMPGIAFIPFSIKDDLSVEGNYSSKISAILSDMSKEHEVSDNITKVLSIKHKNIGKNMYIIERTSKQNSGFRNVLSIVTVLTTSVATISLMVGGVGVMNIMFVSVSERVREIGTRKALGATGFDIMKQFLMEATIICSIGGLTGLILGLITSFIISKITGLEASPNILSIIISIASSSLTGIFFGLYPAKKASDLNPIDSLRI